MHVVVDTNVLVIANGVGCEQASQNCKDQCRLKLGEITVQGIIVIDDSWLILTEYINQFKDNKNGKAINHTNGIGREFLNWVLTNRNNSNRCNQVRITPTLNNDGSFEEFPNDPGLAGFDLSDRKFVAVACAHPANPPIVNAADRGWKRFRVALEQSGVKVEFLCPDG